MTGTAPSPPARSAVSLRKMVSIETERRHTRERATTVCHPDLGIFGMDSSTRSYHIWQVRLVVAAVAEIYKSQWGAKSSTFIQ